MKLTPDHSTGIVIIDNNTYMIEDLKQFLIKRYPSLVEKFFIRAIHQNKPSIRRLAIRKGQLYYAETIIYPRGKTIMTYDWTEIFKRAERTILPIQDFIIYKQSHEVNRHRAGV